MAKINMIKVVCPLCKNCIEVYYGLLEPHTVIARGLFNSNSKGYTNWRCPMSCKPDLDPTSSTTLREYGIKN